MLLHYAIICLYNTNIKVLKYYSMFVLRLLSAITKEPYNNENQVPTRFSLLYYFLTLLYL